MLIEILYCGICHSDIHQTRDEWGGSIFPMVPGHEIVGRVARAGSAVKRFNVGELAGGLMLIARLRARWPAVALAVFLVPTAALFHNPAGLAGMEAQMQVGQVLKNLAIIGGLLSVAAWGAGALSLAQARRVGAIRRQIRPRERNGFLMENALTPGIYHRYLSIDSAPTQTHISPTRRLR